MTTGSPDEKPPPLTPETLRRLLRLARPYRTILIVAGVLMLLSTGLSLSLPLLTRTALDRVLQTHKAAALDRLALGLIGLILASLVNMFFPSGTMSFIISAAGVLIFSGLIACDTQKIKEQYSEAYGTDVAEKMAIFGALSLYLDFVNLFQFLMSFMGQNRE